MYIAIFFLLIAISVAIFIYGIQKKNYWISAIGGFLAICAFGFPSFLSFWGEYLWFDSLGYSQRFWTFVLTKVLTTTFGLILGWGVAYLLTRSLQKNKTYKYGVQILGAFVGVNWGFALWEIALKYLYSRESGVTDPILNYDVSFYLFSLPFYDALYSILFLLTFITLIATLFSLFYSEEQETKLEEGQVEEALKIQFQKSGKGDFASVYVAAGAFLLVLAFGMFLNRFHLMYSDLGAVSGPGWTDVNIRMVAFLIMSILLGLSGIIFMVPRLRTTIQSILGLSNASPQKSFLSTVGSFAGVLLGVGLVGLVAIPAVTQWLIVEPNEITKESAYIKHNIEYTKKAFDLADIEEKEFAAEDTFTEELVDRNQNLFENIRLWDYRALDSVYEQFQEIRLYYEFPDVDIDRYTINGNYQQVMISPREMELNNLPEQSQTFVNRRFKYTHGYGITLTTVNEFTPEGLPHLLIKDIPPKSEYESLNVERPEIYYGTLTKTPVVVNSKEKEFDYPSGDENIYTRYQGTGGVEISNFWRKFLFGWKMDGSRFLFSTYPTSESRVQFHRQIEERLSTVAPFLEYDNDPYIVLNNGQLYWIVDAYTTSEYYPYSEPFTWFADRAIKQLDRMPTENFGLEGVNYIHNSVKAVVNAYNGDVDLYVFEPDDPIIQVWEKILPELFHPQEDMPEGLYQHIRYPADFLLAQGMMYAKYHMEDPTVFYNQEDLWVRATEKYYNRVQAVQPYYILWQRPEADQAEFVLMLPFTPKNRQVMIGWIAGMCDPQNYGRLLAYQFPKEKRVIGPQQVETKIDQDPILSQRLTLWDQRGSSVIRGNVLAIPVEETVFYVEPIYLQAETAAYPELRLVIVMHNDNMSYGESFDEALKGIFQKKKPELEQFPEDETILSVKALIEQANQAFENYLQQTGEKQFQGASRSLQQLQQTLQRLRDQTQNQE